MTQRNPVSRRRFLQGAAAVAAATPIVATDGAARADSHQVSDQVSHDVSLNGRVFKTLKVGMVGIKGSLTDRFTAAKAAGFAGVEMDSPGMKVDETRVAVAAAGLPVDGTVVSSHWSIRHTDPKPETRAKALEDLKTAIRDTHSVGGHTALLVVGHGKDGDEDEIWKRSIDNISQAIPLAAEFGVVIAIENVWNHFLYDHGGDTEQSADKFVKYVDEFDSPWVGMQFDIGNHWKYGNTGDWIRELGRRIVKLDAKGFDRKTDKFTKIGEGDVDWADVRKALKEINFIGWCAAEVAGGDEARLREISANMDRVFGL